MDKTDFILSLKQLIKTAKFDLTTEKTFQADIEKLLIINNIKHRREYHLTETDIIDFYFTEYKIGLEVKLKGSPLKVSRQITRYMESDQIAEIIILSNKNYNSIPVFLNGKKTTVIWLLQV